MGQNAIPEIPAVTVRGVTKQYRQGELSSLKRTMRRLTLREHTNPPILKALDEVSLEARGGQAVAFLGQNGSGKSTLLHMISGITLPTAGSITVKGKLLPLFAVGMSFHPELTGRENAVLFGTIVGLRPSVIVAQMPEITAFAELEGHLDTPVKRYSDGMKARLSFAIAIRFPSDIYIFDEVLAVVDDAFRDRCLEQMNELRRQGKLILFVSHDMRQVERLCTHAVWLDHGQVRKSGLIQAVLPDYERDRAAHGALLRVTDRSLTHAAAPAIAGGQSASRP